MSEAHSVYTYDNSDEWLERNIVPDMLLVHGLSEDNARRLAARLEERYPADTFEVRDPFGAVVGVYGAARGERARPVPSSHRERRTLGGRGRG